jgi:hypothetical protein
MMIYMDGKISTPLPEFFKKFWDASVASSTPSGNQISVITKDYQGTAEEAEAVNEFERKRREFRVTKKNNPFTIPDFYERSPMLGTADILLKAIKEGMVSELILITSSVNKKLRDGEKTNDKARLFLQGKRNKMRKTFEKFPLTKVEWTESTRSDESGEFIPYRWEVLRDKYPDFDIFIDDNPQIIKECVKNLPVDKVYALCDYRCNRGIVADNVYMFPVTVSDLKDEDFVYQPQTSEPKIITKEIQVPAPEKSLWKQPSTYLIFTSGFILASLIGLGIYYWMCKKNKKS